MSKSKSNMDKIKQLRDELRLQSHLFSMEAKDEWNELEDKWSKFSKDMEPTRVAMNESSADVGAATKLLMEEMEEGYYKIKKSLKEKMSRD